MPSDISERAPRARLPILDGLRGVAALLVVAYHVFDSDPVNSVNHGYLAVDFFFLLSGYVMGYAYDHRWGTMSLGAFLRRRLVRLHPMVVAGSVIGAACFYLGASELFGLVDKTGPGALLLAAVLGALLIPMPASMDVRGWGESYPLNGPKWSLLYEYLANLAYALWLRRLGVRALGALAAALGAVLAWLILTSEAGSVAAGWLLTPDHVTRGAMRMLFPFVAGLFLFRLGRTIPLRHGLLVTAGALLVALPMPRLGGAPWVNGLYECVVLLLILPLVVLIGAGSRPLTAFGDRACEFLGELSYPLYLAHYPLHYVFFGWLSRNKTTAAEQLHAALGVYLLSIALGYVVMRWVDKPIRRRLAEKTRD